MSVFQFLKTFLPPLKATIPAYELKLNEKLKFGRQEDFDRSQLERRIQSLLREKVRGVRAAATLVLAIPNILDECESPTVTLNKLRYVAYQQYVFPLLY